MIITSIKQSLKLIQNSSSKLNNQIIFTCTSQNNNNSQKIKEDQNLQQNTTKQVYIHPVNYNKEQFRKYSQKVQQVLKEKQIREEFIKTADPVDLLPRRQRRIYDRPKFDLDISNYGAWRIFNAGAIKNHEDGAVVVCKIPVSPKDVQHVFGQGSFQGKNNGRSTKEFDFQDNNNDIFLIYDWKATTDWNGPNIEGYDYENQDHIYPKDRKIKYPTVEEFWQSEEKHLFRVNCSKYADHHKFKKWFLNEIETKKNGPSLDEIVKKKFGEFELYNDFNKKDHNIFLTPPVFKYDKTFWLKKGEKLDQKKVKEDPHYQKIQPSKQLDDKFLVSEEQKKLQEEKLNLSV